MGGAINLSASIATPPAVSLDQGPAALQKTQTAGSSPIRGQADSSTSIHRNLGRDYTSWGTNQSLGSLTTTALKWLSLSTPAHLVADKIQGGRDAGARYWAGAAVHGLANITGGAAKLIGGTVSFAENLVTNLASATLRALDAGFLGIAGALMRAAGNEESGNALLADAKQSISGISFLAKGEQRPLDAARAAAFQPHATLARISSSSKEFALPPGFKRAELSDIPASVLAFGQRADSTGEAVKLRFNPERGELYAAKGTGERWAALKVGVFKNEDTPPKVFLSFVGTQGARPATVKSDVVQALGIEDSAFEDAGRLVEAFAKEMGAENVKLIGHSLGGALAQYAGIKHGVEVTAFNSAGLHVNLRNGLGADRISQANVTHINTAGDPLSQGFEGRRSLFDASAQVGQRFVMPEAEGRWSPISQHKMEGVLAGFDRLLSPGTPPANPDAGVATQPAATPPISTFNQARADELLRSLTEDGNEDAAAAGAAPTPAAATPAKDPLDVDGLVEDLYGLKPGENPDRLREIDEQALMEAVFGNEDAEPEAAPATPPSPGQSVASGPILEGRPGNVLGATPPQASEPARP